VDATLDLSAVEMVSGPAAAATDVTTAPAAEPAADDAARALRRTARRQPTVTLAAIEALSYEEKAALFS
jgi:hypothetical protein